MAMTDDVTGSTTDDGRAAILTAEQGFAAMFAYLNSYWEEFKTANLVDVLGDMNPAQGGRSADPAAWEDWLAAVRKVTSRD